MTLIAVIKAAGVALVLDSDGENIITTRLKLHAVTLAVSKVITSTDEFTVNVECRSCGLR